MKVKNITDQDLTLPGIGHVKAGGIIEVPEGFHNANFEKVKEEDKVDDKKDEKVNINKEVK
jgi:hypothetical protein